MKKVSIIIPVYRAEQFIAATIQSVLEQTHQNFEVLIVDDGSPDRSIEICQQFKDSRIKILRQKNRGLSGARNTGIRHAQGEYLAFLDPDDLWLPEKLEKHVQHLNNSPDVGVSFSRSGFINEEGESLGIYQMPMLKNITPQYVICRNPIGNGSAGVFRKEVFEAIKYQDNIHGYVEDFYFDERFRVSQDVECWLRIVFQTSWQLEGIPEALTLYRVNSQGLSSSWQKKLESVEMILEKTHSYAPEFIDKWKKPVKAYYLRYVARRAVSARDGATAVQLFHRAITTHWRILLEEPMRTILTGGAAYLLSFLPQSVYKQLEAIALKLTGANQQRRILQEQSS
ncbi:MAG: glycosyltransferase family 2 protein [Merismopedia sp. SIO2A8]|nr:glycosyltransferase family 2 protein [Symploca sp. SIO2B6]NET52539.1 glycosyltransferase family 2 protein [Merismopedia sp. SIO2A8]